MSQKTKSLGMLLASAAAVIFTTLPATSAIATDVSSFSVETPGAKNECKGPNSCPGKSPTATTNPTTTSAMKNKYRKRVRRQLEQPTHYPNQD
ncbi:MAG: hypothetical protein ACYCQI_08230 [Gammaproteobacteria bacterium]